MDDKVRREDTAGILPIIIGEGQPLPTVPKDSPHFRRNLEWLSSIEASLAIVVLDFHGAWLAGASDAFLETLGLDRSAVGCRVKDVLPERSAQTLMQLADRVAATLEPAQGVLASRTESRETRGTLIVAKSAVGVADGVTLEIIASNEPHVHAVRDRALLFEQLNLINNGATYVYEVDHGGLGDVSLLLGYDERLEGPADTVGYSLVHTGDRVLAQSHRERVRQLEDGEFAIVQLRIRRADGKWRWIELRERAFSRRRGAVHRVLGFAVDVTEQRRLLASFAAVSKALLTAEEQERRRIARELHDSVAQHLVAIDLTVSRFERQLGDDTTHRAIVQDIREALTTAHREVRTFSYLLHPPNLERLGLKATLERFLSGFAIRTGLQIGLLYDDTLPGLGPGADLALFRVVQEALMNVHKHARAKNVEIRLKHRRNTAVLLIRDDGVGLSASDIALLLDDETGGVGVAGMRARVEQIGGRFGLRSGPAGLTAWAKIPASSSAETAAQRRARARRRILPKRPRRRLKGRSKPRP